MTMHSIKPEWDTPPNGDFASYVERLSAAQALQAGRTQAVHSAQVAQPPLAGGISPGSAQAAARQGGAQGPAGGIVLPPDLVQLVAPFIGLVRTGRVLLAFFAGVHALTLVLAGQGSWLAVVVMAAAWWGMGQVIKAVATGTVVPSAAVTERLRQEAQRRKTGNKK